MDNKQSGGLFTISSSSFQWNAPSRHKSTEDSHVEREEELEEEIEEELEEEIEEEIEEGSRKETERRSEEHEADLNYSENTEYENSEKSAHQRDLEEEREARAALEEALKKERRARAKQKRALERERKEADALAKALRKERDGKNTLRVELEHLKGQMSDLKRSQKEHQRSNATLKAKMSKMKAYLKEDEEDIEKLQRDLAASSVQHKKEMAECGEVSCAEIKARNKCLKEQQRICLEKDAKIQSMRSNIQKLHADIEAKDSIVSSLQEKVNTSASDLIVEQTKNGELEKNHEAAVYKQQQQAEERDHLTHEKQLLASENKKLRGDLESALHQSQLAQTQLQKEQEARSGLEEAVQKQKSRFARASKKIQTQEKELSEKTLALGKSLAAETLYKSLYEMEKQRFEQLVLQKHAEKDSQSNVSNQLREFSEHLMYKTQTLETESENIRAKFNTLETECDRLTFKHRSLSDRLEEVMSQKNDFICENQTTIAKMQRVVDDLQEQLSERKTIRAKLEDALKAEKTRSSELEQRVKESASVLEEERKACETHCAELKDALAEQTRTMEEQQKLATALAQDSYCRLQDQMLVESGFQKRDIRDLELRLSQQKSALGENSKVLHSLQKDHTDLGKKHSSVNSEYHELLKSYSCLQIKYEKLSYAQGQLPELSPPPFRTNVL